MTKRITIGTFSISSTNNPILDLDRVARVAASLELVDLGSPTEPDPKTVSTRRTAIQRACLGLARQVGRFVAGRPNAHLFESYIGMFSKMIMKVMNQGKEVWWLGSERGVLALEDFQLCVLSVRASCHNLLTLAKSDDRWWRHVVKPNDPSVPPTWEGIRGEIERIREAKYRSSLETDWSGRANFGV